jgi:arylsulfatase
VAEGRIELTAPLRFSLDESFDIGQDTGTPVIDEYDAKMPFAVAGTLNKVEIDLGANQLTPEKRGELERLRRDFALRMQ